MTTADQPHETCPHGRLAYYLAELEDAAVAYGATRARITHEIMTAVDELEDAPPAETEPVTFTPERGRLSARQLARYLDVPYSRVLRTVNHMHEAQAMTEDGDPATTQVRHKTDPGSWEWSIDVPTAWEWLTS